MVARTCSELSLFSVLLQKGPPERWLSLAAQAWAVQTAAAIIVVIVIDRLSNAREDGSPVFSILPKRNGMKKSDIVDIIAEGTGLTKLETQAVIDGFLATTSFGLKNGERIELRGFGNFKVVTRKARLARNPKTNEPVQVPERLSVVFRPSKDLKEYINKDGKNESKS